jgi:hypothetical protein
MSTGISLGYGTDITVVANYSAILALPPVTGEFYWASNSQGTSWLPGSLGGTYYNSGLYYYNGTSLEFLNVPYQATQIEVDAGIINDKFVSPSTLKNAAQWDEKVNVADLPATLIFYPTTVASSISSYYRLVTDINDPDYDSPAVNVPTGTITTTNQLIAELASDAGIIVGNPGVVNMVIVGNIRRTTMSGTASFYYEVYHRDNLGTETLIATSSTTFVVNTNTYTEFYAPALINNGTFTATDRIVFKFYGNKVSSPDSAYEFQFGGTQPVRASFPVPFNVIPVTGGTWGSITGTLSSQTDLQTALDAKVNSSITDTGVLVDFTTSKIFNTPTSPATGNITEDLTNAKIGIVQKIYHNHSVAPTFPAGWVKIDGEYVVSIENIIFAEWISGTRVEYWIVNASTAGYVVSNSPITGATKTKITYDSKGLVTAGADATTADIADSTNKRYVTDAQQTVLGNTSGINTGDETQASILSKLGMFHLPFTPSSIVTGTTSETQVGVVTIPANSIKTLDDLKIYTPHIKSGGAGTVTITYKLTTSSTLPSGNTDRIATFTSAAANLWLPMRRNPTYNSNNLNIISNNGSVISDLGAVNGTPSILNYDNSVILRLFVSVQLSNSADSVYLSGGYITNL